MHLKGRAANSGMPEAHLASSLKKWKLGTFLALDTVPNKNAKKTILVFCRCAPMRNE